MYDFDMLQRAAARKGLILTMLPGGLGYALAYAHRRPARVPMEFDSLEEVAAEIWMH